MSVKERMECEKNWMIMLLLKCLKVFEIYFKGKGKLVRVVVVFNISYIVDVDPVNPHSVLFSVHILK